MVDWTEAGRGRYVLALVAVFAVVAILAFWLWGPEPDFDDRSTASVSDAAVSDTDPLRSESETESPDETGSDTRVPASSSEDSVTPTFDVARVDADGNSVIAGQAEPGSTVVILLDDREISRTEVGPDGSFAEILVLPPAQKQRLISLVMEREGRDPVESESTVIVASDPAEDATESASSDPPVSSLTDMESGVAEVAPVETARPEMEDEASSVSSPRPFKGDDLADVALREPGESDPAGNDSADEFALREDDGVAGTDLSEPVANLPDAAQPHGPQGESRSGQLPESDGSVSDGMATSGFDAPDQERASPTVLLADDSGIKVLQSGDGGPEEVETVVVDTISYDEVGEVWIGGRGTSSQFVRLYLDNRPVKTIQIGEDGQWQTPLADVEAGVFALRVDELDQEGQVISRIETPFRREDRELLADLADDDSSEGTRFRVITVQRGNTLWGIARDRYGEGTLYVRVFEANRARIRDPDLIYPGQIFALPE